MALLVVVNQRKRRRLNLFTATGIAADHNGKIFVSDIVIDGDEGEDPRCLFLASQNPENGQPHVEATIKPLMGDTQEHIRIRLHCCIIRNFDGYSDFGLTGVLAYPRRIYRQQIVRLHRLLGTAFQFLVGILRYLVGTHRYLVGTHRYR